MLERYTTEKKLTENYTQIRLYSVCLFSYLSSIFVKLSGKNFPQFCRQGIQ